MTFVRTVLGDIDPAELGVTYAHEHLVIDGGRPVELDPDFLLGDVDRDDDRARRRGRALGLRTAVRCDAVRCGPERRQARRAVAADRGPRRRADRAPSRPLLRPAHWSHRARRRRARGPVRRSTSPTASTRTTTTGPSSADRPSGRGHQGRRQRGRPVGARPAGLRGRGPRPSRDRRPDPHPLRGRDRRPRAAPAPDRPRRRPGARRRSAMSTRSSTAAITASSWRAVPSSSTTSRSAGATRRTARSSCSSGRPRTATPTGSCSAWTPRGRATTTSTVARPG